MTIIKNPAGTTYKIVETIRANGKLNSVYKAIDTTNQSVVLVKKLHSTHTESELALFQNEYKLKVNHPKVLCATAYFEFEQSHYIIRPFFEGTDCKQALAKKPFQVNEAITIGINVLDSLEAVHQAGIVHCDVRPANILVQNQDVKLIDLGMAQQHEQHTRKAFALVYAAPEQLLQKLTLINATTDLYMLGVSLYEMITGKLPFYHTNPEFVMHLQLTQHLSPHKLLPDKLYKSLLKATRKPALKKPPRFYDSDELTALLASAQEQRYTTASEWKQELQTLQHELAEWQPKKWWHFNIPF